jgi:hypothetical protein
MGAQAEGDMTSVKFRFTILCGMVLGCWVSPAWAEEVTFAFSGHITGLSGDVGFLGGTIPVGTPFSGSYKFESTTPDATPGDPSLGSYNGALRAFSVQVGPHLLTGTLNPVRNRIGVLHCVEGADFGDYYTPGDRMSLLGKAVDTSILLFDSSATAFTSDALPLTPPSLTLFDEREFQIVDAAMYARFFVVGQLTSFTHVPEPGTLALLALGGLTLLRRTR